MIATHPFYINFCIRALVSNPLQIFLLPSPKTLDLFFKKNKKEKNKNEKKKEKEKNQTKSENLVIVPLLLPLSHHPTKTLTLDFSLAATYRRHKESSSLPRLSPSPIFAFIADCIQQDCRHKLSATSPEVPASPPRPRHHLRPSYISAT